MPKDLHVRIFVRTISVAHSPDADDIFMYYAIKFGWLNTEGMALENSALDIETLNVEALKTTYDISAISFALYPKIRNDYALLRTAVSFGEGYGPKLVKKKETKLKRNFKVALSGTHTTNALLFKIAYPEARIVYKNFLEIENAVLSGEVDAGVLIHESILNFSEGLVVEREIWDIWKSLTQGKELPLPLGGMALRRSMPLLQAIACEKILIKAVDVAHTHQHLLSKMLIERNLVRVDDTTLKTYLGLYANAHSIEMSDLQYEAINTLFELGYQHGFYDQSIKAQDYLIPHEYETLRMS
ncbi:MAG: menaquinone biosynthesis family protein [Campylobacterales bacterium]|nr:menaquinone biosynthesis family protein [Campylobacterales bacterium]